MLELTRVAVTGGVASGKSTVCRFFRELGAYTLDADEIVHHLLNTSEDLKNSIVCHFGLEVLQEGKIDRSALARNVFTHSKQLEFLENLIHPIVLQKIKEQYQVACAEKKDRAFIVELPLLFELGWERDYDCTVAVIREDSSARSHLDQYDQRMKRQLSPLQKAAKANYVIQNKGSLEDLRGEVFAVNHILQQLKE